MSSQSRVKDSLRLSGAEKIIDLSYLSGIGGACTSENAGHTLFSCAVARNPETGAWHETWFPLNDKSGVLRFFKQYPATKYDLYSCPNAFFKKERKTANAAPTNVAWCDIDNGDPDGFVPRPNILWETSPGRFQGIWRFNEALSPRDAERVSRWLAYEFGGDRNGWSITKVLRIPGTINHKPEYDRPLVRLLKADLRAVGVPTAALQQHSATSSFKPTSEVIVSCSCFTMNPRAVHDRYRRNLHLMVNGLIRHQTAWECDRSKRIYQIVAAMRKAGATDDEIACIVWNSVYFRSKYGDDEDALLVEMSRILSKLGTDDDQ